MGKGGIRVVSEEPKRKREQRYHVWKRVITDRQTLFEESQIDNITFEDITTEYKLI